MPINEVHSMRMEVAQKREAMVKARSLAVEDARQKAEYLASLHRVQIDSVLEISKEGGGGQFPLVKALAVDAKSVPISAGSQRLSASATNRASGTSMGLLYKPEWPSKTDCPIGICGGRRNRQ